jgi:hypothetical protein
MADRSEIYAPQGEGIFYFDRKRKRENFDSWEARAEYYEKKMDKLAIDWEPEQKAESEKLEEMVLHPYLLPPPVKRFRMDPRMCHSVTK